MIKSGVCRTGFHHSCICSRLNVRTICRWFLSTFSFVTNRGRLFHDDILLLMTVTDNFFSGIEPFPDVLIASFRTLIFFILDLARIGNHALVNPRIFLEFGGRQDADARQTFWGTSRRLGQNFEGRVQQARINKTKLNFTPSLRLHLLLRLHSSLQENFVQLASNLKVFFPPMDSFSTE